MLCGGCGRRNGMCGASSLCLRCGVCKECADTCFGLCVDVVVVQDRATFENVFAPALTEYMRSTQPAAATALSDRDMKWVLQRLFVLFDKNRSVAVCTVVVMYSALCAVCFGFASFIRVFIVTVRYRRASSPVACLCSAKATATKKSNVRPTRLRLRLTRAAASCECLTLLCVAVCSGVCAVRSEPRRVSVCGRTDRILPLVLSRVLRSQPRHAPGYEGRRRRPARPRHGAQVLRRGGH